MATHFAAQAIRRDSLGDGPPAERVYCRDVALQIPLTALENDLVDFFYMPRGARIFDLWMAFDAFGSSVTFDLGLAAIPGGSDDNVDIDALIDGLDVAAAGVQSGRTEIGVFSVADLELDDDYLIQGKILGADVGATAVDIELFVYYRMPVNE